MTAAAAQEPDAPTLTSTGHYVHVQGRLPVQQRVDAIELRYGFERLRTVPVPPRKRKHSWLRRTLARMRDGARRRARGGTASVPRSARQIPFEFDVSAIVLPQRFDLDVVAIGPTGAEVASRTARGHHDLRFESSGLLQPLLVSGASRGGTTYMMRLLAAHPEVSCVEIYPYEVKHATYWVQAMSTLAGPSEAVDRRGARRDSAAYGPTPFNPYIRSDREHFDWFAEPYLRQLVASTQSMIEEFYRSVAARNGKTGVTRFAEKFPGRTAPNVFANCFEGTREIFLVRDTRDVFCSVRSINARRGTIRFGAEVARNDIELFDHLLDNLWRRYDAYTRNWPPELRLIVRYEDLMRDGRQELLRILRFAGIDASEQVVAAMLETARRDSSMRDTHMTSESAEASVGRWRSDLGRDVKSHAERALVEFGRTFGYDAC